MWINNETGAPAYLVEHGTDVTFSSSPGGRAHKPVPAHEFFATHREATAEELKAAEKEAKAAKAAAAASTSAATSSTTSSKPAGK